MKTLYDLLGVSENAKVEEIKIAYNNILNTANISDKKKNQLRIAYEILLDENKRKKYDKDLSNLRAEELLKQVQTKKNISQEDNAPKENNFSAESIEESHENINKNQNINDNAITSFIMEEAQRQINENNRKIEESKIIEEKEYQKLKLKKIEEEEYQKALKKEEKLRKKKIKRAERDYKDAYAEAYHAELKKLGYDVKAPWTRRRIKSLLISLFSIILVIFIAWQIPYVRNFFYELYYSNYIIKIVCDIFISIINSVKELFIK